jgi:outer membrane protein assembly factor BamE
MSASSASRPCTRPRPSCGGVGAALEDLQDLDARQRGLQAAALARDLLGSPMLADAFHADRWDYVFTIRRQGAEPQARQLVARFEGERLKVLEVPQDLPTEEQFVASINTFKPKKDAPKLELSEAERAALPRPARTAQAVVETPQGAVRSYPPLEK